MRFRALGWLVAVWAALGTGSTLAHAADGTPTYWNLSLGAQKPVCRGIVSKADRLDDYFEARHRTSCSTSDQGDHRILDCGGEQELIVFSREACLVRADLPQSENQKRTLAAFTSCMKPAQDSFALDDAILYCTCMARNVLRYSDDQLAKMSRAETERLGKQCLYKSGAVWSPPPVHKRAPAEAARRREAPAPVLDEAAAAGQGTCFAVSRDGLVLTALHVVEGAPNISVRFVGGTWIPASLRTADREHDLAVLRVNVRPRSFLSLVPSDQVSLGQGVFTVGFPISRPQEENAEYAEGAIRSLADQGSRSLLQISARIEAGNSGGPLVTEAGDVVGIVDNGLTPSTEASYAIKADFALELLPAIPRQAAASNRQVAIQRAISAVCAVRATK